MMGGVRAYNDWQKAKLSHPETFNVRILESNLNDVKHMHKKSFEFLMCMFIVEVVKMKDGTDYSGTTLYQFCVTIQKYLFTNRLKWKLIKGVILITCELY